MGYCADLYKVPHIFDNETINHGYYWLMYSYLSWKSNDWAKEHSIDFENYGGSQSSIKWATDNAVEIGYDGKDIVAYCENELTIYDADWVATAFKSHVDSLFYACSVARGWEDDIKEALKEWKIEDGVYEVSIWGVRKLLSMIDDKLGELYPVYCSHAYTYKEDDEYPGEYVKTVRRVDGIEICCGDEWKRDIDFCDAAEFSTDCELYAYQSYTDPEMVRALNSFRKGLLNTLYDMIDNPGEWTYYYSFGC